VTSKDDLQQIVDHITKADGFINVLIANSGISGPGIQGLKPESSLSEVRSVLWATDSEAYTNTYAVNSTALFFSVIAFLELLDAGNAKGNVEQKSQVIATSSVASFNRQAFAGFAYGTSKAAVTHLMKQFSTMLSGYHIRSNVIAPGCKHFPLLPWLCGERREGRRNGVFLLLLTDMMQYTHRS
jgi:NAD(P)-dependent dehydrogenase (short-subunit alcohol dehydrogenase family)